PDQKFRRAGRGFVHRTARLSASALADLLVRPIGSASTYSRAALGALGNLGGMQGPCKGVARGKSRSLRILNNQHFHSDPCSLWITADHDPSTVRTSDASGSPPFAGSR